MLTAIILSAALDLTIPKSEKYWQFMNVVDVAQTYYAASLDTCYSERNFITREMIGRDPHPDRVIAAGVFWAVTHVLYTNWLENADLSKRTKRIFRVLDFGSKGLTIGGNHYNGVRITGKNKPRNGRTDCFRKHKGY